MLRRTRTAPPNSVVLLEDAAGGDVPEAMGGGIVAATESCIAIGCLADISGETEFALGAASALDPGAAPAFQGEVATPSRKLVLRTVQSDVLLEAAVGDTRTKVRIWLNHASEPDRVLIGIVEQA